jgi:hypothetical protein
MATHTITSVYNFQYRFKCEHCGQTTEWLPASLQEDSEYKSGLLEGKRNLPIIQQQTDKEFVSRKVPALRKRVEAGEYDLPFGGLDSRCPACKKRQSWEKGMGVGTMAAIIIVAGGIAMFGWSMFTSGASTGNGKRQLAGLIIGGFGALGFLTMLISGIYEVRKKIAVSRDSAHVTVRLKPEFNWSKIKPAKD